MGNINDSKIKYVLLYGEENSGKTLFQYRLQQLYQFNSNVIKPTFGVSYEVLPLNGIELGIFDLSGSQKQYNLVNIVTKAVNIEGIIFIVSIQNLDNIDQSRDALERILGNNFIDPGIALLVIYNKRGTGEKFDWMTTEMLDNRLNLPKLAARYNVKQHISFVIDIDKMKKEELERPLNEFQSALSK